jgi:hypothetical protein
MLHRYTTWRNMYGSDRHPQIAAHRNGQDPQGQCPPALHRRTVKEFGPGGQRRAERELGFPRETIRKGSHKLQCGVICLDNFAARGRKRAEDHLPHLLTDITAIVDSQSQADPQFRTQRLYTRLDAAEVRQQLIAQKGYTDAQLPTVQTITTKLNALGYYPQKVAKSTPKKRSLQLTPSSIR